MFAVDGFVSRQPSYYLTMIMELAVWLEDDNFPRINDETIS